MTTWPRRSHRHLGPALVACVVFLVLLSLARSVDVPRTGYGIKSDEATYVAMALSVAYDGDLTYRKTGSRAVRRPVSQRTERHLPEARQAPARRIRRAVPLRAPVKRDDANPDRLYYGKAFIYPVLAAPLVRLYGLNGLLIANVLLLAMAVVCAYVFLAAQSPPASAALFTSAFFGAAALPVYGAFLMPDIFNLAVVLLAYFLWLYKEVRAQDVVRLKPDTTYEPTPVVVSGTGVVSGFSRTISNASVRL